MKVIPKLITLKDGRNVVLRSPLSSEAQMFLNHLVTTHTESYQNLDRKADSWLKMSVEDEAKIIEYFSTATNRFFIVAIADEKIFGGMGVVGDEKDFRKHSASLGMSIQEAYSGVGLGTEMMKYAFAMARSLDILRLELTVRTYNKSAIALYEKMGFQKVGRLVKSALVDGEYVDEFGYQVWLND